MTLLSAHEDFQLRTLSQIGGLWPKLQYLSGLKQTDGRYQHWGLAHSFGEATAQRVIAEAHRNVVLQILRTPIQQLLKDANSAAQNQSVSLNEYVGWLSAECKTLLAIDLGGGSVRHFNSVLMSLTALAGQSKAANLQAS